MSRTHGTKRDRGGTDMDDKAQEYYETRFLSPAVCTHLDDLLLLVVLPPSSLIAFCSGSWRLRPAEDKKIYGLVE